MGFDKLRVTKKHQENYPLNLVTACVRAEWLDIKACVQWQKPGENFEKIPVLHNLALAPASQSPGEYVISPKHWPIPVHHRS